MAEVCAGENGGPPSDSQSWNPIVSNNSAARESVAVPFFQRVNRGPGNEGPLAASIYLAVRAARGARLGAGLLEGSAG